MHRIPSSPPPCLLQSDVPVELLDAESNVAIVSRTETAGATGLLATYRCQEAVNRLELRVRTVEGRYGSLQALPAALPAALCGALCAALWAPLWAPLCAALHCAAWCIAWCSPYPLHVH